MRIVSGPPGCLAGDQMIAINRAGKGYQIRLDDLVDRFNGGTGQRGGRGFNLEIPTFVQRVEGPVIRMGLLTAAWESGIKPTLTVRTAQGRQVTATAEHPFLTNAGWSVMGDLRVGDYLVVNAGKSTDGRQSKPRYASLYTRFHPHQRRAKDGWRYWTHRLTAEAGVNGMTLDEFVRILRTDEESARRMSFLGPAIVVHHKDHDWTNNHPDNLEILTHEEHRAHHANDWTLHVLDRAGTDRVTSIREGGMIHTYDLEVADDPHNFLVNGVAVHNTGKTTWLANDVRRVVKESGPQVAVLSFTRAAAAEIAGRDLPVHPSSVGTLHSLAYRALDRPELVVEHLGEWNETHPEHQLSVDARSLSPEDLNAADAGMFGVTDADKTMSKIEIYRARRTPVAAWGGHEQAMWKAWENWKRHNGLFDFTDLIEHSLQVEVAPGNPQVGWVDEAQDLTLLELTLVRHWGKQMRELTIVGDDDQAIFTFKGASPEAFLDPSVPDESRLVLDQSYRVPRAVHALATRWIEQLGSRRLTKVYRPRDADGLVRHGPFDFTSEALVRDAIKQIEAGRSVVILATTSFGLNRVKDNLRLFGVPFHNPLRRSRPDWNPLHPSRGVSTAQKILAYLALDERIFGEDAREWTGKDVKAWSSLLAKTGVFRRGAAAMIAGLPDRTLTYEEVASLFDSEEVLERALEPSLPWLRAHLQSGYKQTAQYPLRIAEVFGPQTLAQTPLVSIGTVHSYKGGQGDVVYVSPDISLAALRDAEYQNQDALIRLFYVAMTRAREELVLCAPTTRVNLHKQLTEGLG